MDLSDGDGGGEDRLSALPDDLLIAILVLVDDAAAAARTSILASRWRRLWALLPELRFSYIEHHRIGAALAAHEAPDLSRLVALTEDSSPESVSAWLPIAARGLSGAIHLEVVRTESETEAEDTGAIDRPCFEKATAIMVKLGFLGLALPPSGVFARLGDLQLVDIQLHGQSSGIGDLLSSQRCPSLRFLLVSDVRGLDSFSIHSDSLLHMKLSSLHHLQQLTVMAPALKRLKVSSCFTDPLNPDLSVANISAPQLTALGWKNVIEPSSILLDKMMHLEQLSVQLFIVEKEEVFRHQTPPLPRRSPAMKQLHKSPTHAPSPAHAPASKVSKPARPGPRTWVGYLLREQRLLFVLLGALIATSFFLLRPYLFSLSPSSVVDHSPIFSFVSHSSPSRVPAGFRPPPRRVVVTGGAGFVGSHLVDRLLEQGNSVIVVDNFFTGRKENIAHHLRNPRFELLRHDVVEPILLEVDRIYHLACPASPVHYKFNPIKTIKTNVMGTLNMLGLAKRIGARFLLTSTSEVYGDPLEHPQKETYWGHVNPIGVRSCYDEGKRTAETLTMDYHRGGGVAVRIARIFNTYGPRMCLDDGRVVSNFVAQALRRHPMTVYGDGKQTRSFQYVSDLVAGLMALMESDHIGPFNLGNPGEFTMLELAEVVKETIDPMSTIEFKPNTADDPHMRKPDITKAKQLLGWEPKVSLKEGLPLMVTDFRQRILDE